MSSARDMDVISDKKFKPALFVRSVEDLVDLLSACLRRRHPRNCPCYGRERVMAEGGMGESSAAVSQPPGAPVAAALRTVFSSCASPDAEAPNQVCQVPESQGVSCCRHFGRDSCSSLQGSTKWTRYSLQALFA
jgi:hypothetical protein